MNKAIAIAALALAALTTSPVMAAKTGQTRVQAVSKADKKFGKLDADADGTLTSAELTTAFQARATKAGKTYKPRMANRMMRQTDTNGDGKITRAEFTAGAGARFDKADVNKNGSMDEGEGKARSMQASGSTTAG